MYLPHYPAGGTGQERAAFKKGAAQRQRVAAPDGVRAGHHAVHHREHHHPAVIAMLPMIVLGEMGLGNLFTFSGVSLLIMVGVGLDTVKQIESQLQQRSYEGFLR
jgi:hypothetical protein